MRKQNFSPSSKCNFYHISQTKWKIHKIKNDKRQNKERIRRARSGRAIVIKYHNVPTLKTGRNCYMWPIYKGNPYKDQSAMQIKVRNKEHSQRTILPEKLKIPKLDKILIFHQILSKSTLILQPEMDRTKNSKFKYKY